MPANTLSAQRLSRSAEDVRRLKIPALGRGKACMNGLGGRRRQPLEPVAPIGPRPPLPPPYGLPRETRNRSRPESAPPPRTRFARSSGEKRPPPRKPGSAIPDFEVTKAGPLSAACLCRPFGTRARTGSSRVGEAIPNLRVFIAVSRRFWRIGGALDCFY